LEFQRASRMLSTRIPATTPTKTAKINVNNG
jgi:hypothetical protein